MFLTSCDRIIGRCLTLCLCQINLIEIHLRRHILLETLYEVTHYVRKLASDNFCLAWWYVICSIIYCGVKSFLLSYNLPDHHCHQRATTVPQLLCRNQIHAIIHRMFVFVWRLPKLPGSSKLRTIRQDDGSVIENESISPLLGYFSINNYEKDDLRLHISNSHKNIPENLHGEIYSKGGKGIIPG